METSNVNFSDTNQHGGIPEGRVNIQGLKKPSNIRNDKELEAEISRVCETLKDTCKYILQENYLISFIYQYSSLKFIITKIASYDWKKRTESLKRVQEISLLFDDVVEGLTNINGQYFLTQMSRLYVPLTAQVS